MVQEGSPGTASPLRSWRNPMSIHDVGHRGWIEINPQLAQLTLNAVVSPAWVLARHLDNPRFNFRGCAWSSASLSALERPLAPHGFSVPVQDGFRPEQSYAGGERLRGIGGSRHQPMHHSGQRHLLSARDVRPTLLSALHDPQLLSQQEEFQIFLFTHHPADSSRSRTNVHTNNII